MGKALRVYKSSIPLIGIFSWGAFGDVSDRLVGHPQSVDAVAINTEAAIRVCGLGMVQEVTDDGYTCKKNAE